MTVWLFSFDMIIVSGVRYSLQDIMLFHNEPELFLHIFDLFSKVVLTWLQAKIIF